MTKDGNTEAEIKTRINKARGAFAALKNIWKMKMISKKTKIRIFKSNVLSVLLYICCRVLESDQRNMPHAGSIPKQVPQKNSAHLLAKQDNQCGAPRPNWDAAHLVRSKEKKMEVDWPRKQNATRRHLFQE